MNVLLLDFDLFAVTGGGQTFYRAVIEANPEIQFAYYRKKESADTPRPTNATSIPFAEHYHATCPPCDEVSGYLHENFLIAMNAAFSAAGMSFDLVDSPDYTQEGCFILAALNHHGVWCRRHVLSMHGTVSHGIATRWPGGAETGTTVALIAEKERLQYITADIRYGISRAYLEEWFLATGHRPHYFHPAHFHKGPEPVLSWPDTGPVNLNFVGRKERLKGPDLFLDLVWWLRSGSKGSIRLIGGEVCTEATDSQEILRNLAANRNLQVSIEPGYSKLNLTGLFNSRSVTFVPSRRDTFNLVALESLFAGCPTVIGSGAGVCRFLGEELPNLPYIRFDTGDPFSCVGQVEKLLTNYDARRSELLEALQRVTWQPREPNLSEIYQTGESAGWEAKRRLSDCFELFLRTIRPRKLEDALRRKAGSFISKLPRNAGGSLLSAVRPVAGLALGQQLFPEASRELIEQVGLSSSLASAYSALSSMPEHTEEQRVAKREKAVSLIPRVRLDRGRLFHLLSQIERRQERDLVGAAYELRLARWLGPDRFGGLINTKSALLRHGFGKEALAAPALFSIETQATDLLEAARQSHLAPPAPDFAFTWDTRSASVPRVSVIVSLYKTGRKLQEFLRRLASQTLVTQGALEVVLVDSGSPDNEFGAARTLCPERGIQCLYVRCNRRETIQMAWNRGITLARAPYLAFLGVDEMDHPEALEILARELDRDPGLDWIQGSNVAVSVTKTGVYESDASPFDRPVKGKWAQYLDCTSLSFVGALYRKSIHERFGYYDSSFGAAGDNEFKNRVLPFINVRTLDLTLGQYLNYPEVRTTVSPRAEIEDTRAWYLHRTPAGMNYAFPEGSESDAIQLLRNCLGYRKCYWKHTSTDIELATSILAILGRRLPGHPVLGLEPEVAAIRNIYRALQFLPDPASRYVQLEIVRTLRNLRRQSKSLELKARKLFDSGFEARFGVLNDNQFEQHYWAW